MSWGAAFAVAGEKVCMHRFRVIPFCLLLSSHFPIRIRIHSVKWQGVELDGVQITAGNDKEFCSW